MNINEHLATEVMGWHECLDFNETIYAKGIACNFEPMGLKEDWNPSENISQAMMLWRELKKQHADYDMNLTNNPYTQNKGFFEFTITDDCDVVLCLVESELPEAAISEAIAEASGWNE